MGDLEYTYKLYGGARDGEVDTVYNEAGVIDNILLSHPNVESLCEHYRLNHISLKNGDEIDFIKYDFVRELQEDNLEAYMNHYVDPLTGEYDGQG